MTLTDKLGLKTVWKFAFKTLRRSVNINLNLISDENAYFKVRKETMGSYRRHVRVFRPWRSGIQFTSIPLGLWPQLDVSFQTLYFCGMEINCHIGRKMVKKFISIFNETEVLESIWWRRNITPLNWVVVPFRLIFDSNSSFLTEWKITFHEIPTDSNKKVSIRRP